MQFCLGYTDSPSQMTTQENFCKIPMCSNGMFVHTKIDTAIFVHDNGHIIT